MENQMKMTFPALPENEALARMAVSAFVLPLDPTLEQLADIKTAVSEAVTNSIIHGYPMGEGTVTLSAEIEDGLLRMEVRDTGVGIENVQEAMRPFYTTKSAGERSGMGFLVMQSFMDDVEVRSAVRIGTSVRMTKRIRNARDNSARMA